MELTWPDMPTLADQYNGKRSMIISYTIDEILDLALTPSDHRFVRECEQSNKLSDKLLLLEFYARKLEEQAEREKVKP